MKYLQNGSYQNNPLMRLTLGLTLLFLIGFVVTNFALFFSKMDLTPTSIVSYYNGSEEEFRPARSFQSMLEVTHGHLPMMALILLLLTHLVIFAPFSKGGKIAFIMVAFLSGLLNEGSSWLVRFVHPDFAWLKIFSYISLQASLLFLLGAMAMYLVRGSANGVDTLKDAVTPAGEADKDVPLRLSRKGEGQRTAARTVKERSRSPERSRKKTSPPS